MSIPRKHWITSSTIVYLFAMILGGMSCSQGTIGTAKESPSDSTDIALRIEHGDLVLEMNNDMQTKISANFPKSKPYMDTFQSSERIKLANGELNKFAIRGVTTTEIKEDRLATQWIITGLYDHNNVKIEKKQTITKYADSPDMLTTTTSYKNNSETDVVIEEMASQDYTILSHNDNPKFWAFQGSSSDSRSDWITPISAGYYKKNYMGMNNSDYGGGIPVTSVWRPDAGIAIGHTELKPKLVSLPTEMSLNETTTKISVSEFYDYPTLFEKGEVMETVETFVMVHQGDYYKALQTYSKFMQGKGIELPEPEPAAFESIWCAWGYEREFELSEIIATLPKVKELGIKWAVLDDGFQIAEGDWDANPKKFPRGNVEIKELVDKIHQAGLKAKVWWTPLAADPASNALTENPDMRLYKADWSPQFITWWDAYYLAPVNDKTTEHTKEVLDLFLKEWDFDGLKMDGQHMNATEPDHNPASKLDYPEQAPEGVPDFFHMIYDYTRSIKPAAVVENCPCGTCMSFYNMPAMNQAVSSDPLSSWQIRHKGKTYKALIPKTAYYGDHVELSDNASDFASSFGIGAVLGTKFTWPKDNPKASESFLLTPEKEVIWKKWFSLYDEKMLSKEEYLGHLYDIGYDKPEAHAIKKGNTMYYAFYLKNWDGRVNLRGLESGNYTVKDYYNDVILGEVSSDSPFLRVAFNDFLLLEVTPK